MQGYLTALRPTVAHLRVCRHEDAALAILSVDDFNVHHAGAQLQELQVIADDCGEVLVVVAVAVAVEVGAVAAATAV